MAQVTQEEKLNRVQGKSPSGKYADGKRSFFRKPLGIITIGAGALLVLVCIALAGVLFLYQGIYPGVQVGDLPVGKMEREEAQAAL